MVVAGEHAREVPRKAIVAHTGAVDAVMAALEAAGRRRGRPGANAARVGTRVIDDQRARRQAVGLVELVVGPFKTRHDGRNWPGSRHTEPRATVIHQGTARRHCASGVMLIVAACKAGDHGGTGPTVLVHQIFRFSVRTITF